jgi:hypothetical protein
MTSEENWELLRQSYQLYLTLCRLSLTDQRAYRVALRAGRRYVRRNFAKIRLIA